MISNKLLAPLWNIRVQGHEYSYAEDINSFLVKKLFILNGYAHTC